LSVSAKDKSGSSEKSIKIENQKGRLSEEEIERMVEDSKKFEEEDRLEKEKIEAKNKLETYIYSVMSSIKDEE